jgi:hypothetical protein
VVATTPEGRDVPRVGSSWIAAAVAWLLVGAPLAWGVFNTVKRALALFR